MMKKKIFCAFLLSGQIFLLFGQQSVTFKTGKITIPKVLNVHLFLAGNFNSWNPADTTWELHPGPSGSYTLSNYFQIGIYDLKIPRGTWQRVECTAAGKSANNRKISFLHETTFVINVEAWQNNYPPAEKKHTASSQVQIL